MNQMNFLTILCMIIVFKNRIDTYLTSAGYPYSWTVDTHKNRIAPCLNSSVSSKLIYYMNTYTGKPVYILKLKFSKYPLIHTNYIISPCTTL